jgi:hypothetical protein
MAATLRKNCEPANVVDAIANLANGAFAVAHAITPRDAAAGRCPYGGHVQSATEAMMGITQGLQDIAVSIRDLADAIREQHEH